MDYAKLIRETLTKMQAIFDAATAEGRELTAEEQAQYDDLEKKVEGYKASAERQKKMEALVEADRTPAPANNNRTPAIRVGNNLAGKKPWLNLGEFLLAVKNAYDPSRGMIDERLVPDRPQNAATGMSVSVSSDGGFMVTTTFVKQLMDTIMKQSSVLPRISMIPIGDGSNGIEMPALAETSRVDGSRFGGVRAYWATEAGTATATKPVLRSIVLKLEKLLAFAYMTEELMRDASAMEAFVRKAYADEMTFKLDDAIINGSGKGQPLGIVNSPALIQVTKETGQAADTVVWENIVKMWSRLAPGSKGRSIWLAHNDVEPQLMTMTQVVGTGGVPVYLPAGGASASPYGSLMGRPVIVCEQCPKLGDVGDLMLCDMADYIGIDKGGLESDTSIHVQFLYDENVFRFRYRFNGAPYTNSAVTMYKGTNTLSPYVAIAAR